MTVFVPEADRLLQAAAAYLEQELLPTLAGYHRFQTRICINVLRIVCRELQQGGALQQDEHARLVRLLRREGSLENLNDELARQLADGAMPLDADGLFEHLRLSLRDALRVNNPGWIEGG
ncbi:MAG: hypothetical protein J0H09_08670 [Burkholderiales bacterium]|nr:hypothetical protein [Burkholderiales bacterium]